MGVELKNGNTVSSDSRSDNWFVLSAFYYFIMKRLKSEQRLQIVEIYFEYRGSVRDTFMLRST